MQSPASDLHGWFRSGIATEQNMLGPQKPRVFPEKQFYMDQHSVVYVQYRSVTWKEH